MSEISLEERVKSLEKEIERIKAVNEIQNLVGTYEILHTPKTFGRTIELFAMKQPDVSVEIADWGVYTGATNFFPRTRLLKDYFMRIGNQRGYSEGV